MNNDLKAREGDFLETNEGLIFDVKGIIHPPEKIIAFLRYYPDKSGNRWRNGVKYKKVYDLHERFQFLRKKYPFYLFNDRISGEILQGVPKEKIRVIYHPVDLLKKLRKQRLDENSEKNKLTLIQQKALELTDMIVKHANINYEHIGITGASLVDLETEGSDIDLIVYGSKNAYKVRNALTTLIENSPQKIQSYSKDNIVGLYNFRGRNFSIPFETFIKLEQRKKLQGIFDGVEFYIRCIKDWTEIEERYGDIKYKFIGLATLQAKVIEDSESLLTPCKYVIETTKIIDGPKQIEDIKEIVSFRGRFCEQSQTGEEIEARGKIELVRTQGKNYFRLLVGNYKEDYITVMNI